MHNSQTLNPAYLGAESFHAILFRLPLNSALEAAMHGQVPHDVVNTLLSRGANPRHVALLSSNGPLQHRSMLSKACKYQTVNVVQLLLEQGARSQPESYDSFHWTLMRNNAAADHIDIFRLLYDAGLLSWTKKTDGGRLLHCLVSALMGKLNSKLKSGQFLPIVKLVLERQPELVLLSDIKGRTPLTLLIERAPTSGFSKEAVAILKVLAKAEQDARLRGAP